MTHKQLVRAGGAWLKRQGCLVVVSELVALNLHEIPDDIGFKSNGDSILLECKTSRADFFRDGEKIIRLMPETGLGKLRYFLVPKGLIKPEELPENWGLLEHCSTHIKRSVEAKPFDNNIIEENKLLISMIRRLKLSSAVYVVSDEEENN